MAVANLLLNGIRETHPISQACQRVTCVVDLKHFRLLQRSSSERDQRILAASRSAKRALLHRERRVQIL